MVVGEVVAGKYVVERVLGRGGMGEVVVARHSLLGERVAIKTLLADASKDPEAVQRFLNEARASLRIRCEHVVRVSDVDLLPTGQPYMVMELLEGHDLEARLQEGPLAVAEAIDLLLQACEGVAEAHMLGIVHRDLKPANMYLTRRSDGSTRLVLLDFGISKFADTAGQGGHGLTSTTSLMGSPSYMSPEQFQNPRDVDPRTDVWALGVILFRLLAGRLPFVADSLPALVVKVLHEPPAGLRAIRPDVPPLLEGIVAQCLKKARDQRFKGVAGLALALAPYASRDGARSIERLQSMVGGVMPAVMPEGRSFAAAPATSPASAMGETRALPTPAPRASSPVAPPTREALALPDPVAPVEAVTASNFAQSQRALGPRKSRGLLVAAALGGAALVASVLVLALGGSSAPAPTKAMKTAITKAKPAVDDEAPDKPTSTPTPPAEPSASTPLPIAGGPKPKVLAPSPTTLAPSTTAPSTTAPSTTVPSTAPPKPSSTINDDI